MAKEAFVAPTGQTWYVLLVRPADGWYWNGSGFEAYNAANFATYVVSAAEDGATGIYQFTVPGTLPAGNYNVVARRRVGGSPSATADENGPAGTLSWDGTNLVAWYNVRLQTPAEAAGRPTTLEGMMRRVFEGRHNKRTRNRTTGVTAIRNAADTADLEVATQSTAGVVDTQTAGG